MKTRNGFVSNSSSSSFVVGFRDLLVGSHCHKKLTITGKQYDSLVKFGFRKIKNYRVHGISDDDMQFDDADVGDFCENLGYHADCNDYEKTAYFLIKNGIPFNCLKDYGDTNVLYDGSDYVTIARNYGNALSGIKFTDKKLLDELLEQPVQRLFAVLYMRELKGKR